MSLTPRRRHLLESAVSLLLLGGIAYVLQRELRGLDFAKVGAALQELRTGQIIQALLVTAMAYTMLACYDSLALRWLRHPLAVSKSAAAAMITYAFNFNLGPIVGAVGMRLRLYGRWGLTKGEIARVVTFCAVTSWIGYCLLSGIVILLHPPEVPARFDVPWATFRPLAAVAFALAGLYLLLCRVRKRPLKLRGWSLPIPSTDVALRQMAVGAAHWSLAGLVVWSLFPLPHGLSYLDVLSVHLLASVVALVSHVPGGLGVIEGTYILLLGSAAPPEAVLGALVAYRVAFYILPLLFATVAYVTLEARRRAPRTAAHHGAARPAQAGAAAGFMRQALPVGPPSLKAPTPTRAPPH